MALSLGESPDGATHSFVSNVEKSQCNLLWCELFPGLCIDGGCQLLELLGNNIVIQRHILSGAENFGKVLELQAPEEKIGISNRERASLPIAGRAWVGASAIRADIEQAVFPGQDRASTGRNSPNV